MAQRMRTSFERILLCVAAFALFAACGPAKPGTTPDAGVIAAARQPDGWDSDVALKPAEDVNPDSRIVEINLEARVENLQIKPGLTTPVWTYNGTLPGPLIHAKKGQRLIVHFTNHLAEPTTIHWHGLRVPAAMDGSEAMQSPVQPGGTFDYAFDLLDSGTYWYHPHINSSAQVGYGLYGAIQVDDPDEPADLGDDLVLMLSDMGIEADGSLTPGDQSGWFGDYFGRQGNTLLVNGKVMPKVRAKAGAPQRWRVINAARARFMKFSVPGQKLIRIGGDGGLMTAPQPLDVVLLAPGERAELFLLPKHAAQDSVTVQWIDPDIFHLGQVGPPIDLFQFEVTADPEWKDGPTAPPAALRTIDPIATDGAVQQLLELTEQNTNGNITLGINGVPSSQATPLMATVNTTEVWTVKNTTNYDHPFHLHGFFFQVLDLNGVPPSATEWKDTFNVPANKTMRFAVHYDNRPGMWMFHCHILDHADLGMMGMLHVMEP